MPFWTNLNNVLSAIVKRPSAWLLGVVGTVAGACVTDSLTPVKTFLFDKAAELSCQYRHKPISEESQFTILVSPLAHDPDESHTERVMRAFLGEEGFCVIPICESLNFIFQTICKQPQMTRSNVRGA